MVDKEAKEFWEEALKLLTFSDPNNVDTGAHWLNPGAHPVDQVVEAVGKQRLIEHCLLAFGINEDSGDPTLIDILEHFTIAELITAYQASQSERKHRAAVAFHLMDMLEEYDTQLECIIQYPYPKGYESKQTTKSIQHEEKQYWQEVVSHLLSPSPEIAQSNVQTLSAKKSSIQSIIASVSQQVLLEVCLCCYDIHAAYKDGLDHFLTDFSIPQLAAAYINYKPERYEDSQILAEPLLKDIKSNISEVSMERGLFWLLEQKDPEFKWAFWETTPKYPMQELQTNKPIVPKTGEFRPEEE